MSTKFNILRLFFKNVLVCTFFSCCICGLFSPPVTAQTSVKDSLLDVIAREGKSLKGLRATNLLAIEYLKNNPDSDLQLIEKFIR